MTGLEEAISRQSGFVISRDGTQLYYSAACPPEARATVLIVHGYCEHGARYEHVMRFLAERGYEVAAFDLRGHGRSQGRRSHIDRFREYVDDVDAAVGWATARTGVSRKLFLLGHSLGGLVVTSYLLEHPEGLDGVVLSSPFLGFRVDVGRAKRLIGRSMSLVWPTLSLPTDIPAEDLSTDPEVGRAYERDPLVNKVATVRWFTETLAQQRMVMERAREVLIPTLLLQAGADRIADAEVSQRFLGRLGATDQELKWYDDLYHEVLNEVRKGEVLVDLLEWLEAH